MCKRFYPLTISVLHPKIYFGLYGWNAEVLELMVLVVQQQRMYLFLEVLHGARSPRRTIMDSKKN